MFIIYELDSDTRIALFDSFDEAEAAASELLDEGSLGAYTIISED